MSSVKASLDGSRKSYSNTAVSPGCEKVKRSAKDRPPTSSVASAFSSILSRVPNSAGARSVTARWPFRSGRTNPAADRGRPGTLENGAVLHQDGDPVAHARQVRVDAIDQEWPDLLLLDDLDGILDVDAVGVVAVVKVDKGPFHGREVQGGHDRDLEAARERVGDVDLRAVQGRKRRLVVAVVRCTVDELHHDRPGRRTHQETLPAGRTAAPW